MYASLILGWLSYMLRRREKAVFYTPILSDIRLLHKIESPNPYIHVLILKSAYKYGSTYTPVLKISSLYK